MESILCVCLEFLVHCYIAGDVRVNVQPGLGYLHLLFVRFHNYLVDQLKEVNDWDSKRLFDEARKIVGASIQHITYREWFNSKFVVSGIHRSLFIVVWKPFFHMNDIEFTDNDLSSFNIMFLFFFQIYSLMRLLGSLTLVYFLKVIPMTTMIHLTRALELDLLLPLSGLGTAWYVWLVCSILKAIIYEWDD